MESNANRVTNPDETDESELEALMRASNDFDVVELDEQIALNDVPDEVRQANLYVYSDAALAGRLVHYEREALFERDSDLRAAWRQEVARTRIEISRRRMYGVREAERRWNDL